MTLLPSKCFVFSLILPNYYEFFQVHLKSLFRLLILFQNFTVVDSFCTSRVVYWQKDTFMNLERCIWEAMMPQSQKQGANLQVRDVRKMLNFLTTGHRAETRWQQSQRRGKIHRNSSTGIHELKYNCHITVISSNSELLIVVQPDAICYYYISPFGRIPVESSKSELSNIVRQKWYKNLMVYCKHYCSSVLMGKVALWSKVLIQNFRSWCDYFSSELSTLVRLKFLQISC